MELHLGNHGDIRTTEEEQAQADALWYSAVSFMQGSARQARIRAALALDFDDWYAARFLLDYPDASAWPWDQESSAHMAYIICRFLLFRLQHTHSRNGFSSLVCIHTFIVWAKNMAYIAAANLLGPNQPDQAHGISVMRGDQGDRQTSLWRYIHQFAYSTAMQYNLPREVPPHEFFGLSELNIIVRRCEQKALQDPANAMVWLTVAAAFQLIFATGVRISAIYTEADKYLREEHLEIMQRSQGRYEIQVDFKWLKGFSLLHHDPYLFNPTLHSVALKANVKAEFATTIIPLLVQRGAIYEKRPTGLHYFSHISEFHASKSTRFHCRQGNYPLFRSSVDSSGRPSNKPLTASGLCKRLKQVALELYLAGCRLYNWRRGVGDISRIVGGMELQQTALNHNAANDVGRGTYSNAVDDAQISRYVFGEFLPSQASAKDKLDQSRFHIRSADSRAVQSMLHIHRSGLRPPPSAETVEPITEDEISQVLSRNHDFMAKMAQWEEAMADPKRRDTEDTRSMKRDLRRTKQAAKSVILSARSSVLGSQCRSADLQKTHGTMAEYQNAGLALQQLNSALPLLITPNVIRGPDFDPDADWNRVWPNKESEVTDDDNHPYLEEDDDADPIDAEPDWSLDEDELCRTAQQEADAVRTDIRDLESTARPSGPTSRPQQAKLLSSQGFGTPRRAASSAKRITATPDAGKPSQATSSVPASETHSVEDPDTDQIDPWVEEVGDHGVYLLVSHVRQANNLWHRS